MIHAQKNRGFTLIEMLTALFILSITIAFVMIVTQTVKSTRDSTYENIAFHISESKLEELRAGGYAALPASGPFSEPELASLPQGAASTTVTAWNAKTKKVEVGVSWFETDGATHVVTLATLMTQTGGL